MTTHLPGRVVPWFSILRTGKVLGNMHVAEEAGVAAGWGQGEALSLLRVR